MEINEFYGYAQSLADKIKAEKPSYAAESGAALCLIALDSQEIIPGVSCISIRQDQVVMFSAEHVAVVSMVAAGHKKAKRIVILSLADGSIQMPEESCLNILLSLESENENCEIVTAANRTVTVRNLNAEPDEEDEPITELLPEPPAPVSETVTPAEEPVPAPTQTPAVDFFSGFGDDDADAAEGAAAFESGFDASYSAPQHAPVKPVKTASADNASLGTHAALGAPADFASGVTIDENNPFNAPSAAESAPVAFAEAARSGAGETAAPVMTGTPAAPPVRDANLSPEELLKKAKKKKNIAKSNFHFFK